MYLISSSQWMSWSCIGSSFDIVDVIDSVDLRNKPADIETSLRYSSMFYWDFSSRYNER
jgi:hypothetical protein